MLQQIHFTTSCPSDRKCTSEDEMRKKTKEYQTFVLKDIFLEYKLKEYINSMKKIVQKNVIP